MRSSGNQSEEQYEYGNIEVPGAPTARVNAGRLLCNRCPPERNLLTSASGLLIPVIGRFLKIKRTTRNFVKRPGQYEIPRALKRRNSDLYQHTIFTLY